MTDEYKATPLCSAYDARSNADVHYDAEGLLLHEASWRGQADVTPLHHASKMREAGIARLLLEHGAAVLLEHKADVHIRGRYWTPFRVASSRGRVDIAQLLLEHGGEGVAVGSEDDEEYEDEEYEEEEYEEDEDNKEYEEDVLLDAWW
ncbi:hypothetical protein BJV77DRAFT_1031036 [Russula vinacea]|nr:hypothetical protein BJV77DRAFT_1031036 [Russula vinacea]